MKSLFLDQRASWGWTVIPTPCRERNKIKCVVQPYPTNIQPTSAQFVCREDIFFHSTTCTPATTTHHRIDPGTMVITSRTFTTLFAGAPTTTNGALVRLPLSVVPYYETRCPVSGVVVPVANKKLQRANLWSSDEHERFLHGLELFPNGPWKEVAKIVGTKTTRQTMTHAQKYRQKIERRLTGKVKEPKQSTAQRRRQVDLDQSIACMQFPMTNNYAHQTMTTQQSSVSDMSSMSFMDELLACTPVEPVAYAVSSPTEVCTAAAFDASFLDQEFNEILATLVSAEPNDQFISSAVDTYTQTL